MKLESLGSYKRDAVTSKIVLMVSIMLCLSASLYFYIDARNFIRSQSAKKIVIDRENHAWLATEKLITRDDRRIQYEAHLTDFYNLFFAFDGGTFDTNVNRALNLMDGEIGKSLYIKQYVENALAREVTEQNWSLSIEIVKVDCDVSTSPARGTVFAVQTLTRPAGQVKRNMNARFSVVDARVSYDNPRGVMITMFDIFDNSRIASETKAN